jgi:malic enzyme
MVSKEEALAFHTVGRPGKIEVVPTKPAFTQHDLSLAYSPGVAAAVPRHPRRPRPGASNTPPAAISWP